MPLTIALPIKAYFAPAAQLQFMLLRKPARYQRRYDSGGPK
ncbi:MAG: hypothetical protein WCO56_10020 [Verrucomicrobiota bacterium]